MPRKDLGYSQASRPNCSTDAECRQCRESNPEPRRLRRSFSSPDPCLVRRILTGLDQPTSDAVAGDVPTTCRRLPRGFHRRVGVTGFEPAPFWSQTRRATKLRHTPMLPSHVLASARPGFARRPIGSRRCLPGVCVSVRCGLPCWLRRSTDRARIDHRSLRRGGVRLVLFTVQLSNVDAAGRAEADPCAGMAGLEPATCGFGDRCSPS